MKAIHVIKGQKGAALVEFAIILPLLAVLFGGMIELGLFLYNQQVITNASREAARAGIVKGSLFADDTTLINIIKNYCDQHLVTFQGSPEINSGDIIFECGGSTCDESTRGAAAFQTDFTVQVSFDYYFLLPSLLHFDTYKTLTATTTMRIEQQPPS